VAQVDANGRTQAHSGGTSPTLMVASKPTPVAQVDANGRIQAHSGGTSRC
jgi:hypothetical protein